MSDRKPLSSHTDRRVIRTRKAIATAYLELLTTTDYHKITITALAKKADIDRKTFYTHYASTDELFKDIIRQSITQSLSGLTLETLLHDPAYFTKQYLYILGTVIPLSKKQRAQILEHIPMDKFLYYGITITREQIFPAVHELSEDIMRSVDITLSFYLGGIFHAYACWLKSDNDLTFDELIEIVSAHVAQGLSGVTLQQTLTSSSPHFM